MLETFSNLSKMDSDDWLRSAGYEALCAAAVFGVTLNTLPFAIGAAAGGLYCVSHMAIGFVAAQILGPETYLDNCCLISLATRAVSVILASALACGLFVAIGIALSPYLIGMTVLFIVGAALIDLIGGLALSGTTNCDMMPLPGRFAVYQLQKERS